MFIFDVYGCVSFRFISSTFSFLVWMDGGEAQVATLADPAPRRILSENPSGESLGDSLGDS